MSTSALLVPVLPGHFVLADAVSRGVLLLRLGVGEREQADLDEVQGLMNPSLIRKPLASTTASRSGAAQWCSSRTSAAAESFGMCISLRRTRDGAAADQPYSEPHHVACGVPHPRRVKAGEHNEHVVFVDPGGLTSLRGVGGLRSVERDTPGDDGSGDRNQRECAGATTGVAHQQQDSAHAAGAAEDQHRQAARLGNDQVAVRPHDRGRSDQALAAQHRGTPRGGGWARLAARVHGSGHAVVGWAAAEGVTPSG